MYSMETLDKGMLHLPDGTNQEAMQSQILLRMLCEFKTLELLIPGIFPCNICRHWLIESGQNYIKTEPERGGIAVFSSPFSCRGQQTNPVAEETAM